MQTEQHLTAARQFLTDATTLEAAGSTMGAAEMIWVATVQALEAIAHIKAGNARGSLSSRRRRETAENISFESLTQYRRNQHDIHGHFYKNHLSPAELAVKMQQGRDYIAELLAIALSPESAES